MEDEEIIEREVIRLRKKGLRNYEIQEKLGLTENVLSEIIMSLIYAGKITRQTGADFRRMEVEKRAKRIAKMRRAGLTNKEIADKEGVTVGTITEYVRQFELPLRRRRYRQPTESDGEKVVKMYQNKHLESEIAKELDLSPCSVRHFVRAYRLDVRRKRVEIIIRLKKSGATTRQIAKALGISDVYVCRIIRDIIKAYGEGVLA